MEKWLPHITRCCQSHQLSSVIKIGSSEAWKPSAEPALQVSPESRHPRRSNNRSHCWSPSYVPGTAVCAFLVFVHLILQQPWGRWAFYYLITPFLHLSTDRVWNVLKVTQLVRRAGRVQTWAEQPWAALRFCLPCLRDATRFSGPPQKEGFSQLESLLRVH